MQIYNLPFMGFLKRFIFKGIGFHLQKSGSIQYKKHINIYKKGGNNGSSTIYYFVSMGILFYVL